MCVCPDCVPSSEAGGLCQLVKPDESGPLVLHRGATKCMCAMHEYLAHIRLPTTLVFSDVERGERVLEHWVEPLWLMLSLNFLDSSHVGSLVLEK